jgi:hypothetical protein
VDLFASKKNRLLQKYASVIPSKDPDNIGNTLRLDWSKIKYPALIHPPIPLILKSIQKFAKEGTKAIIIVPKWRDQVWSELVSQYTLSKINLRKTKNILKT